VTPVLAALLLMVTSRGQDPQFPINGKQPNIAVQEINHPGDAVPVLQIQWGLKPLEPARKSPKLFGEDKIPWEFPWLTVARGTISPRMIGTTDIVFGSRFRVYSQDNTTTARKVAQMYGSLWDDCLQRLHMDHSRDIQQGIIDVFLCWGGKPGGEQLFDKIQPDPATKKPGESLAPIPLNTIYIYDLNSFTEPVEMAREVAHEYGHAVLASIGGYKEPEVWANGYLGERLFLRWFRDRMKAGTLTPDDAMGADAASLDKWVAKNVDPLVTAAAIHQPTEAYLKDSSAAGMNKYIGLALYADTILPDLVFGRSTLLTGSTDAWDYPEAIAMAAEEPNEYDLTIPPYLANQPIFVPRRTMMMRSQSRSAVSNKCVEIRIAAPEFRARTISSLSSFAPAGSIPINGSSKRKMFALWISAHATESFCRIPLLRVATRSFLFSVRSYRSSSVSLNVSNESIVLKHIATNLRCSSTVSNS